MKSSHIVDCSVSNSLLQLTVLLHRLVIGDQLDVATFWFVLLVELLKRVDGCLFLHSCQDRIDHLRRELLSVILGQRRASAKTCDLALEPCVLMVSLTSSTQLSQ